MENFLPMHCLSGYAFQRKGNSLVIHADCLEWMRHLPDECFQAIVTDPPYGLKEYESEQLDRRATGQGGIWRIPPAFDGHCRSPLPRFTALNKKETARIGACFEEWATLARRVLCPGGHVFLASNIFLSQIVFSALVRAGLEFRGQVIRLVRTLRGGDRPKGAEVEFPTVCSLPRGCHEPWGIFRKPLPPGMTVSACLRQFHTGGLRRKPDGNPFEDVIESERTPRHERILSGHPSLKPQSFLRQIVHASLPLGKGIVLDPFMGSGSTIAAAEAIGYHAVGVEKRHEYYLASLDAIPLLAAVRPDRKPGSRKPWPGKPLLPGFHSRCQSDTAHQ